MNLGEKHFGFTVVGVRPVPEIGSEMIEFVHDKTKAKLIWMNNREENKLFSVAFKTLPSDDTGVFHILEHSVLSGSKNYPVKEPFLELLKSSMNTYLNAMTFPDKTVFPVSSRNDTDFMNLAQVYLDAVFCPAIYDNPCIFAQEGWHYELRDPADSATFKGVVFNEMKGALSSVHSRLNYELHRMLYPESCYRFVSGGDPAAIPDLTYEQFLATHRRFYHPSNAYFYLDGPVDIERLLRLIDEQYLAGYDALEQDFDIVRQGPITPTVKVCEYDVGADESTENRTHLVYGKLLSDWNDRNKNFALAVLGDMLTATNDAPLKRALLDSGLCNDMSLGVNDGTYQTAGVLHIQNTEQQHGEALLGLTRETVAKLIAEGLDRDDLSATIDRMEFILREGDEPKALDRDINVLSSWLYGGDPLLYIGCDELFAFLREQLHTDYYERLLSEWLLEESGSATLYLVPSAQYGEKLRAAESARLQTAQSGWTEAEAAAVVEQNRRLDEWQRSEDTPEALATLPKLPLSEVSDRPEKRETTVSDENGVTVLYHPAREKGIHSASLYFSLADCDEDQLYDLSVMSGLYGQLPTHQTDSALLQRRVSSILGDLVFVVTAYSEKHRPETCRPYLAVNFRYLERNRDAAFALVSEILNDTDFDRPEQITELLKQGEEMTRQRMQSGGHNFAMRRVRAAGSAECALKELTAGYENYRRLRCLARGEEDLSAKIADYKRLAASVICRARVTASLTAFEQRPLWPLLSQLPQGEALPSDELSYRLSVPTAQGISTPTAVSFAAMALSVPQYDSSLWNVLSTILSFDYLWNEIRVKGGAYGAGMGTGNSYIPVYYSYRDPSPATSLQTFRKTVEFVREFVASVPSLDPFIISTVAKLEPLQSDASIGALADECWFRGLTEEMRIEARRRLLSLKPADLLEACDYLQNEIACCVVGSETALATCEDENLTVVSVG
ncbi:MAG: insulinase family protein [Clostridia bacterium]|nr:insulinase family protein [Clostridia bacterium]